MWYTLGTMSVKTAVIPADGLATRFLPATKAVPKALLPLIDQPLIQYSIEEAVKAQIERIIIVAASDTRSISNYFDLSPELETYLESRNSPILGRIREISKMAQTVIVHQPQPLGLGEAVLRTRHLVGDEPFMVYLPDEIFLGDPSPTTQLIKSFRDQGAVIGITPVSLEQVSNYGIIGGVQISGDEWKIDQLVEKPAMDNAPSSIAVTGPYLFTPSIFRYLESVSPGVSGEIQLTDAINLLAQSEDVTGLLYHADRYDCGTPIGLLKASVEIALTQDEHKSELGMWIRKLSKNLEAP